MSDAPVTSPVGEVATETAVTERPDAEPRDDNEDQSSTVDAEGQPGGEAEAEEEVELDIGGNKHRFKKTSPIGEALEQVQKYQKGLESSLQQKSQEVAANKKSIDDQVKMVNRLQGLKGEQLAVYTQGVSVGEEIARLEKLDLNEAWRSNPDQARQASDRLAFLRTQYQQIQGQLAQYGDNLNRAERELLDTRATEGEQIVRKAIKGFSPQVESEMVDYAIKHGVPEQDAKLWRHAPQSAVFAWKAMQYDKLMAKGTAAVKPPTAQAQPVTPIRGGQGGRSSEPDLENMSMDDYAAHMAKVDKRRSR